MDPRRAPQPVGPAHLSDQVTDLSGDRWAAASEPELPLPEGPETPPMPANHRLRADDRDGVHHARAEAIELDKVQPISIRQPQAPRCTPPQYVHLMAENQILSFEPPPRLHERHQPTQQQTDHSKH